MPLLAFIVAIMLATPREIQEGTVSAAAPVPAAQLATPVAPLVVPVASIVVPTEQYLKRITLKEFGTWVDDGRFLGYHLGEDAEYGDIVGDVPVRAIADGTVLHAGWVSGYGGMMLVRHQIGGRTINAIYGHLDEASFTAKVGQTVRKGKMIAVLGDGETHETDGRRKHLHFGAYEMQADKVEVVDGVEKKTKDLRFNGYTTDKEELATWIDPAILFQGIK